MGTQSGALPPVPLEVVALAVGAGVVLGLAYLDYRREMRLVDVGMYDEDDLDEWTAAIARRRTRWALAVALVLTGYGLGKAHESRETRGLAVAAAGGALLVAYVSYEPAGVVRGRCAE